ncbi:hypothetical protein BH09SUM1_BH09SUM1_05040 [soil metagenome]
MNLKISIVAVVAAALVSAAGITPAQQSFFDALAGPGESVSLQVGVQKDGSKGAVMTKNGPDGKVMQFETNGRTVLKSPKVNIEADHLNFLADKSILEADGDVLIDQTGIIAKSQKLTFDTVTQEIHLTGAPHVEQSSDNGKSVFQGMEEFIIIRHESGATEVQMRGGNEIICEMTSPKPAGAATGAAPADGAKPTPSPAATPAPSSSGPQGMLPSKPTGFAGLGENVKIVTRAREDKHPLVLASTSKEGAFSSFRAEGSVVLESETMNLRADQLEYDAPKQVVDALYNVFIKQDQIDADCGRMHYELDKNRIELSVNPDIRENRPDGKLHLSQMDSYIITRGVDGSVSTQGIPGPSGPIKYEFMGAAIQPGVATPTPTGDQEINLNNPIDISNIKK